MKNYLTSVAKYTSENKSKTAVIIVTALAVSNAISFANGLRVGMNDVTHRP